MMENLFVFWKKIYESRYFWMMQAKIDLKNKFRRSKLGLLWVCVTPLCLTIIMAFVFGTAFHQDIISYAPYVLSGIITWDIFTVSFVAGSGIMIGSSPYIKQTNHPVVIYPLKAAIAEIASFLISTAALGIWVMFINPLHVLFGYIFIAPALIIYFMISWGGMIIASYIGAKYRDYPQLATLLLQLLWYMSPVFFQESMFESNELLHTIFVVNPITHLLELIRKPFLAGQIPTGIDYLISISFAAVILFIAFLLNRKNERDVVFYI